MYPDYSCVDTAFGDLSRRNRPIYIRQITEALPEDRRDCFATWHRFPEGYASHVKERGTVAGYEGPSYADFLPIDFDGSDIAEVHTRVCEFLKASGAP